jgi:KDO2-lipid IV(A) lauroyltransferase
LRDDLVYAAFRGFLAAAGRLPLGVTRPPAAALGRFAMTLNHRDRRRTRAHLRIAFPELNEARLRALMRANARHFGGLAAEVAWLGRATPADVLALCSSSGGGHLERAVERGNGVALITGHCGNWEMLNAWLGASGFPMTIAVRDIYDQRLDRIASRLRSRFGSEVVPRGASAGRRLVAALAENRVIGLLIDQDIRDIPAVFVPFFGRPAWTPSGAASLALHKSAPVVPAFDHRRPDGSHAIEIHPAIPMPGSGTREQRIIELTAAATAAIERQIRAHPEQWVWMHRRWRTRPSADSPAGAVAGTG